MDVAGWIVTGLGACIVLVVLVDVFLAVLHIDSGGVVVPHLHSGIWRAFRIAWKGFPRFRRQILAVSGPVMMVMMFVVWIGLFTAGFACIYWPHLQSGFRSEQEVGILTFTDALYFSGNTGTVLGFGDITPVSGWLKMLRVIQSGLGFALLMGIVTYLLNVVSGVTERNALAARLRVETNGTGAGVEFITHALPLEDVSDVVFRIASLRKSLHMVAEKMHQFPILNLFYRALDPVRDPERLIETVSEIALSARLAAAANPYRRLRPAADELVSTVTQLLMLMASLHLPAGARAEFEKLKPQPEDEDYLGRVQERLEKSLGITIVAGNQEMALLVLATRTRVLLDSLHRITLWRQDHLSTP